MIRILMMKREESIRKEEMKMELQDSIQKTKEKIASLFHISETKDFSLALGCHLLSNLNLSLSSYGIKEGDVLYAILHQSNPLSNLFSLENNVSKEQEIESLPTRAQILSKTSNLSPEAIEKKLNQKHSAPSNARRQLQELMETLIGFPREVEYDEEEENGTETNNDSSEPNALIEIQVDQSVLEQLTEMGFPAERSKKALILNQMNIQLAMEWLINHENDSHLDDPLTQQQLRAIVQKNRILSQLRNNVSTNPSNSSSPISPAVLPSQTNSIPINSAPMSSTLESNIPEGNQQSPQIAQAQTPDQATIQQLRDMGFPEEEVTQALLATGNNQEAAAAWLLGDREPDFNALQSILTNPVIQAGLGNPRVLEALRNIMENPNSAMQYLTDPEIGPILLQVSNVVHNHQ
eukprot:TRINITY_DN3619_c0_g2_i3.p1 TRINITY_DN3619_c0_g2~~TRINITY_DN3619_c0_g2_i3.p1  ORF type:complete len:407 (-),score=131.30 TRINITY_DN3619_c0_g2_i3:1027-2247(-)